jgi:hypothetical protein
MQSWQGQPESALIAKWGPPTRTESDGSGGRILIYQRFVQTGHEPAQSVTTGRVDPNGEVSLKTTQTPEQTYGYQRQRLFYVNKEGTIYRWAWRGW